MPGSACVGAGSVHPILTGLQRPTLHWRSLVAGMARLGSRLSSIGRLGLLDGQQA